MPVTSEQFQSTPLSRQAAAAPPAVAEDSGTKVEAGAPAAPVRKPDPNRVGVVYVHGIGSQKPAETFLDWSGPIVDLLADWRVDHGFDVDPVRVSQFSFSGSALPYLELEVPAYGDLAAQTWIVTEAWWAAQIRAPSMGAVASYLRHGLPRILEGIRRGFAQRKDSWGARLGEEAARRPVGGPHQSGDLEGTPEEVSRQAALIARTLARPGRAWAWIGLLDWLQMWLTVLGLVPVFVFGTLVLLFYVPFRAIPIQAIRDLGILKQADNFLTNWFGDVPTLLDDPVQSANVRARAVEAVNGLVGTGCGRIVVVAHSGGAIVSFLTLVDPAYLGRHVDKLITIGEGLNLAWHLEDHDRLAMPGSRLAGDLATARPKLLWYDFWASYDPAPGGPLVHPLGFALPVTSRPVTNRMSILEDHGAYWENDEGFLIPLIRHIDTASSRPEKPPPLSRFFPDRGLRTVVIERRRQRVAVLALGRWVEALLATLTIVLGTVLARAGAGPAALGRAATSFWEGVPGHQLVSVPLDWLGTLASWPAGLRDAGDWAIGAALVVALFLIPTAIGMRVWNRWDRRERRLAHRSVLSEIHRWDIAGELLALVVASVALAVVVGRALVG